MHRLFGASHVTAMNWTLGSSTVGSMQYQYDADGRVTQKTGSFAQSQLPAAVTANTFNAANEMTSFNGTPLTYDANGNLTNDGTDMYAWDARNHLVGITGGNTASFMYDADGRRGLKTINGTSTQFLYDGLNPVQEIQNSAPSANMLTGLGIDEYFQRTDSGGAHDYLSDILGSTMALTSTSGSIQTQYLYQPFGSGGSNGSSSSNPYQFTGRENDGVGLYFDRARFYNPTFQRFISQDTLDLGDEVANPASYGNNQKPTDLEDVINWYAYTGDDPVNWYDPDGEARKGGRPGKGEPGTEGKNPNTKKHVKPDPNRPGCWLQKNPISGKWIPKGPGWSPDSQFQLPPPPLWWPLLPLLLPWPGNPIWLGA